jgi:streptogramin lyase
MGMRRIVLLLASMALAILAIVLMSYAGSGEAVAQTESGVVTYYASVDRWGSHGTAEGQFYSPYGVASDSQGNVYVADTHNDRIQKFDSDGTFLTKWGSEGVANGQFDRPYSVAVDSQGNVYVADTWNHRIQKFDSDGTFLTKWGTNGTANGQFDDPEGIATDSQDHVYVADTFNDRIQKFDSNGTFLTKWGSEGTANGQFYSTRDVATDSQGNVYVTDVFNNRIQKFDSNGTFLTKWGSGGTADGQFSRLESVAVDSQNDVYVVDSDNLIQKFAEVPLDTDVSAPVTKHYPDSTVWSNQSVTAQLWTIDANGSGGKQITYRASGAQPIPSTTVPRDKTRITISAVGRTTLTFFSTDLAGNTEQPPKSLTVNIDKTSPRVIGTVPVSDAKQASPNTVVKASFSEWVKPRNSWSSYERIRYDFKLYKVRADGSLEPVGTTIAYDRETNKATLTPTAPLKVGATYSAKVNTVIRDRAGNFFDQNRTKPLLQPKVWRFTVAN